MLASLFPRFLGDTAVAELEYRIFIAELERKFYLIIFAVWRKDRCRSKAAFPA
jgi:hypothetical protein